MFARHYLRNLGWFLFLELLRCFSSLGSPPCPYIFRTGYPCGWVSPFGYFRIKACLPAPRNFTQATTSFIACNRLGIHHMHLFAWSYNFKTWTLLNIQASWRMRTSATGVSKATFSTTARLYSSGWFLFHLILGYFVCDAYRYAPLHYLTGTKRSKCFDYAINYYPFWTHILITKICAHFTSSILLKNSLVKN